MGGRVRRSMGWRVSVFAVVAALAAAGTALAHVPMMMTTRQLVRIQGYGGTPPGKMESKPLLLVVLGEEHRLNSIDFRVFGFAEETGDAKPEPDRFVLRGDRAELSRLAAARPEQRVTVLAERRQGSSELFLLALDLCP